jgi:hypothetical protein
MTNSLRRILITAALALVAAAALAGSASALTTTVNQGATGPWLGSNAQWNVCYQSTYRIDPMDAWVGRSSQYPYSNQTIYLQPVLQYTSNGVNWYNLRYGGFASQTVPPGSAAHLFPSSFSNLPSGYGFRVVMRFWWYIGGTQIGYVEDVFNNRAEYYGTNGNVFSGGCTL